MEQRPILKDPFEVHPADNGGFIVIRRGDHVSMTSRVIAAFSNGQALAAWLQQQVLLVEGGVPVSAGSITVTKLAGSGSPTIADEGWISTKVGA